MNWSMLIGYIVACSVSFLVMLAFCRAAKADDEAYRKVCSRCGKSLLEKEKANGWCCDCEGVTLTRTGKLEHDEGLL